MPASRPGNGGEHAAGVEQAALADQARALASPVLAALRASGYPGMQIVTLTTYSPFTAQVKQWQVAAWEIGHCAAPGTGAAGAAVCWLLADGEFAVSNWRAAVEKREAEDLPGLPSVVGWLRMLEGQG